MVDCQAAFQHCIEQCGRKRSLTRVKAVFFDQRINCQIGISAGRFHAQQRLRRRIACVLLHAVILFIQSSNDVFSLGRAIRLLLHAAPAPQFAAQPVFTQYLPRCSRRSRLKFFAELFSKSGEYRRVQHPRQPRCACHGFCWRKALRLNRLLQPAARSLRGLPPGTKGAAPSPAASPKGGRKLLIDAA